MEAFKLTILLLALSGVVLAAPKDVKESLIVSASSDASKTVLVEAASKSVLEEADGEKLQASDSFGLGYYVPYTAPVVTYPVYNYYPGYYHSYRHHGFHGYEDHHGYPGGYGGYGFNYGVYH